MHERACFRMEARWSKMDIVDSWVLDAVSLSVFYLCAPIIQTPMVPNVWW